MLDRGWRITYLGLLLGILWSPPLRAQGLSFFSALRLPVDASVAGLGDYNVAHMSGYASLAWQNPALLATEQEAQFACSFLNYYADIGAGAAYLRLPIRAGRLGIGLRYLSYGRFEGYDAFARATHEFSAQTQLLHIAYGHKLGAFSWGLALVPSYVTIDRTSAYGVFMDLGATFTHPARAFRIGIALKHIPLGYAATHGLRPELRPLDLWVGATYGPEGFPFRFSANFYGLLQRTYYYDEDSPVSEQRRAPSSLDRLLGKGNLGGELLLGKWIRLQAAFTVARRQQFQLSPTAGWAGFSFGAACVLSSFSLHLAQSFHELRDERRLHFGLGINLSALRKRGISQKKPTSPT